MRRTKKRGSFRCPTRRTLEYPRGEITSGLGTFPFRQSAQGGRAFQSIHGYMSKCDANLYYSFNIKVLQSGIGEVMCPISAGLSLNNDSLPGFNLSN